MIELSYVSVASDLPKVSMITASVSAVCEIISNLLLTSTIAIKIWLAMRDIEAASGRRYRLSYGHIITIMVESGIILLILYTVLVALTLVNGSSSTKSSKSMVVLMVLSAMMPQISAFVPLLIIVQIGLGRSFEDEHQRLSANVMNHGTFQQPGVSNQLVSTLRATTENNQESTIDITLQAFQHSRDEESVRGGDKS
ncbi:hypothetical protein PM082_022900 [Marasmius tenuissimus]|nr:hypothetical protein PM082_022900 [Marasmius tenuissimus]